MTAFNPSVQYRIMENVERALESTAPTLSAVREAYGRRAAESWLEIQLADLSEYCGTREKMSVEQTEALARVILSQFPRLRVTDVMLFLVEYKGGKYGRFFGTVDTLTIAASLRAFADELHRRRAELWRKREERRKADESRRHEAEVRKFREAVSRYGVTAEQYAANRELFGGRLTEQQVRAELARRGAALAEE